MQNNNKQFEILDILALMSFYLQITNLEELKRQATNDDIIVEVRKDMEDISKKVDKIIEKLAII